MRAGRRDAEWCGLRTGRLCGPVPTSAAETNTPCHPPWFTALPRRKAKWRRTKGWEWQGEAERVAAVISTSVNCEFLQVLCSSDGSVAHQVPVRGDDDG